MINEVLLTKLLKVEDFLVEQDVIVDDEIVFIRPLYIEKLSLHSELLSELAMSICGQISLLSPEVLYTVEASILPLATLVSQELGIPMCIIRKPSNYKHEEDEPRLFISKDLCNKRGILLDDAIWTGKTIHHVFSLFQELGIPLPQCYFVFDFYDFSCGTSCLSDDERSFLINRLSWITYRELIVFAYNSGLISDYAFRGTMSKFTNYSHE